jgi:hypothetical protein
MGVLLKYKIYVNNKLTLGDEKQIQKWFLNLRLGDDFIG